jgi:hypothetical protein
MKSHTLRPTLALLAVCLLSSRAMAGDTALAETLFRQGRQLMEAGDYKAACPKLAESFSQDPATGTLLALAICHDQGGQTASAWATYAEVASRAKQDGRADREQAARERLTALEPKLSRLTVAVNPETASVQGIVIKRDGIALGRGAWGAAAPVDPGEHHVEATAPGKRAWSASVAVGADADAKTIEVPVLEDEPREVGAAVDALPAGAAQPQGEDKGPASGEPPIRTIGLITGGVGLASLGVSAFFALRAASLNDESKEGGHCDANNECDSTGLEKRDDAVSASTVATITLIAGGVLTSAGVALFFLGEPSKPSEAAVHAAPLVGRYETGLALGGRF